MRHHAVLFMTVATVGVGYACSDDYGEIGMPIGGGGAGAGAAGAGGVAGAAGTGGRGISTIGGGGASNPMPPTPALPPEAPTVTCPTGINGSLDTSDRSQTGRHSRIMPISACGMAKGYPGNAADPTNPHLFDVYRFANPGAAPVCFNFTLTDGAIVETALDAGPDAAAADSGAASGVDGGGADAGNPPVSASPPKYMTAYGTFFPTDLSLGYLGDVGDKLTSSQAMAITVPAGGTIDVVVYAIDNAPGGVSPYALSCSTQ